MSDTRMARFRGDIHSQALSLSTSITVLLPQPDAAKEAMRAAPPMPVLYLLHGLSDDDTAWTRRTSLERYAAPLGMAVVMPQVHRSFYADQAYGGRYWTYVSEELPALVERWLGVSRAREDTFVAGLSMGGYGALKWALREPSRFAAAASLSGALDIRTWASRSRPEDPHMGERIFGAEGVDDGDDLVHLLGRTAREELPALYVACGDEDELLDQTTSFLRESESAGVEVTSRRSPGGHGWDYWDSAIQDLLAWLPLR